MFDAEIWANIQTLVEREVWLNDLPVGNTLKEISNELLSSKIPRVDGSGIPQLHSPISEILNAYVLFCTLYKEISRTNFY